MAFDNIEVEIKIKLEESDLFKIKSKLLETAKLKGTTSQIDTYFAPKDDNFLLQKYPFKWLSIRHRNGKAIINFKHFHPEGAEKHSYCDEFETEISNSEAMKLILKELNISEIVEVNKTRETYIVDDMYEIVLDTVQNLGVFLEIEALKDQGGAETTKANMMIFLSSLGIENINVDYRGYPFQLLKSQGKL